MSNETDSFKYWLIALAIVFIIFVFATFLAFINIEDLDIDQRLRYGIPALSTVGSIFTGLGVLINAYFISKNSESALKNIQLIEDKQITDLFSKAIEQLGSEKIEVRLGGIYTLERIAIDSEKDHWTIMEVLTAFIRQNAPATNEDESRDKLPIDIQECLTVIGRRKYPNPEGKRLDLTHVNLFKANLFKSNLRGSNLSEANLLGVDLTEAILTETNLTKAVLSEAKLTGSLLLQTNFTEANLLGVDLTEAVIGEVDFTEADLSEAKVFGATLTKAIGLTSEKIELAQGNDKTILPEGLIKPEHWISS